MKQEKPTDQESKIFRDVIQEHHEDYFVEYHPADDRLPFATLNLTYLESTLNTASIKLDMEQELNLWLKRYAVPVMVASFDKTESVIDIPETGNQSYLMGYMNKAGDVERKWGLYKDADMPAEQADSAYQARVYDGLPYRLQTNIRKDLEQKARANRLGMRIIIFLMFGVPLLIELISLGVAWIGNVLALISISIGLYKYAKAVSWIKPTKRDQEKSEKETKMKHYYYHCEKNPDGFNRLKVENFEKEIAENTAKESRKIKGIKNL